MKTLLSQLIPAVALAASLTFSGCSKKDRSDVSATAQDAYQDSKAAISNGWDNVKAYSFDKRDDFSASAKALTSQLDAQISKLRADYSEAKASASRKAAMEELKNSETDYKEKVDALGRATADTWDSAKQNVIAAWDRVQASYQKARVD